MFEHSLRIRINAEVVDMPTSPSRTSTIVHPTPDDASSTQSDRVQPCTSLYAQASGEVNGAVRPKTDPNISTSSTNKDKHKAEITVNEPSMTTPTDSSNGTKLIGKINNLATSDLSNIEGGIDFIVISESNCSCRCV